MKWTNFAPRNEVSIMGSNLKWPEDRVDELKRMVAENMSAGQIAAALGVTRNAVIGMARRRRLMFARPPSQVKLISQISPPKKPPRINSGMLSIRLSKSGGQTKMVTAARRPKPVRPSKPDRLLSLFELSWDTCKFPFDVPRDGVSYSFCGAAPIEGGPYCATHAAICLDGAPHVWVSKAQRV
jgi:GcrA cell cycle regulator